MLEYLIAKCNLICDSSCIYSHSDEPLRRKPFRLRNGAWNYIPQPCLAGNHCQFELKCVYAHNTSEVMFHPMIYKTNKCTYKLIDSECLEYGVHCPLAHGNPRKPSNFNIDPSIKRSHEITLEQQLEFNRKNQENYSTYKVVEKQHIKLYEKPMKPENFNIETFKTRFCDKNFTHDQKTCTFYHDAFDKRRKNFFSLIPCKNIFNPQLQKFEDKICKSGDACKFAHNLIEINYHSDRYKTIVCEENPCELAEFCPFIHEELTLSIDEQKKELASLKAKHSSLSTMLESAKNKLEKLKKFVCVHCKNPGKEILHCGHILCKDCKNNTVCPICKVHARKTRINETRQE